MAVATAKATPKGKGKGGPPLGPPPGGKAGLGAVGSYRQRQEAELRKQEECLSAPVGFKGRDALTVEEARVIEEKATEPAGTGEYERFLPQRGYFACRKCGQPIYSAEAKFESGCGWPAFDKCFVGSISTRVELDGTGRTEIVCSQCGGHLGHVFLEPGKHTKARGDQRHCANSLALQYVVHEPPGGSPTEEELEIPATPGTEFGRDASAGVASGSGNDPGRGTGRASQENQAISLLLETQGDGKNFPSTGDLVAIHYTGKLLGGEQFDTSRDGDPFEFMVDSGHVIQGWDDGVKRMPLGSRARLLVPSALAYGKRGMPGAIPPDADLLFDMELLFLNGKRARTPEVRAPPQPQAELTQAGFLQAQISQFLQPALQKCLQDRPPWPYRYLLQHLESEDTVAAWSPSIAPGSPEEYAQLVRPLLEQLSEAVLSRESCGAKNGGCSTEGAEGDLRPFLLAWLRERADQPLPVLTAKTELTTPQT